MNGSCWYGYFINYTILLLLLLLLLLCEIIVECERLTAILIIHFLSQFKTYYTQYFKMGLSLCTRCEITERKNNLVSLLRRFAK